VLVKTVARSAATLGQVDVQAPRLKTAQAGCDLLNAIHRAPDEQVIETFAHIPLTVDLAVVARSIETAKVVSDAARLTGWHDLLDLVGNGSSVADRAASGLAQIRDAVARDQRDLALETVIGDLSAAARMLRMEYELGLKKVDPEAVKRKKQEEQRRLEEERQRQEEAERLREEARRQRIEQEQIETTKRQQREEAARIQRDKDALAEAERRRNEAGEPVTIKANDGQRGIEAATAQVSTRLEDLQKAHPGKHLRITIEVVDP
jgi:hypothetical protein